MNKGLLNQYCRKLGFEIHGTGYIQSIKKESFKEDPFKVQKEITGECSTIFDIGANRGEITARYAELFPKAKIFAFEPFADSFQILASRFSDNKRIECFQMAIGALESKANLFVNKNVDTNSLLRPTRIGLSSDQQVENISVTEVYVNTVDQFCSDKNIGQIDVLKLDIQGGELSALRGATNLLSNKRVRIIYTEAYFKKQYEDQPLFHDISHFLGQYGYHLQDLYNPIYGKGNLVWCDAIFR